VEAQHGWCTWHHYEGCVEKPKIDGGEAKDRWVDVMDYIGLFYPNFTVFVILGHKGNLVISFPINRTPWFGGEASIQPSLLHP
jgi:hypothetical protein